ncbi:hypothetical protein ACFXKC_28285 [Streptomyces sp. NPDC059340]|uniref:hypothetical protein n=1 Tax=Streptomyces sp. NPDC059340 TaxID=3346806 RepID=UPI0036983978
MELHVALSLRLDAVEAYRLAHAYRDEVLAKDKATPLAVSRFDVAMEPALEEEPVFTIGAIAEDGRPVALLLDVEDRRKVAAWLAPVEEEKATATAATATPTGAVFDPLPGYLHAIGQAATQYERDLYAAYRLAITEVARLQAEIADEDAAPELTIYRPSHDSIVMGLYTTAAAAREHCEAEERHSWADGSNPTFDWIEDEEDGVAEMTAWVGGEECTTGYVVTALEVASAYDEEAAE